LGFGGSVSDGFTKFDPVVFWNGEKYVDNFGVELRTGTAANFRVSVRHWKLRMANCYFAHDSLEFPALLPFWDAPSGRSFHSVRTNF
jgi:hypothetical protein